MEACGSIIVGTVIANGGKVVRPSQLIASVRRTFRGERELQAEAGGRGMITMKGLLAQVTAMLIAGNALALERTAEEAAVAKVVRDSICWALTKDRALQESTMAHDEDLFVVWTDSKSAVSGWKQYVKLFDTWMDPKFKATLTEVRDLNIHVSRSGDVAWYSATLDDLAEWDGKPVGARDIRWTGVLEKRRGRWVVVQMHGSVARDKVASTPDP